jgi:L-asparaginase
MRSRLEAEPSLWKRSDAATPTLAMTEAVGRAVKRGTLVAVASRSPQGRVALIYTGGGGGHDLKHAGAIFAGDLNGARTRVLLAVLLGAGLSPAEVREGIESCGLLAEIGSPQAA